MLEIEEEETNLCWELVAVLMRLIEGFTWREDMKDGWVWKVGGEENYVVKQVYQNLVSLWQPSLPREDTHFFRSLWKALAPSKTLGFTGKIMLDRVLTCNNLLRWNIRCDQNNYSCPLCSSCWETTHHVLFSCHVAYSLWMRVYE